MFCAMATTEAVAHVLLGKVQSLCSGSVGFKGRSRLFVWPGDAEVQVSLVPRVLLRCETATRASYNLRLALSQRRRVMIRLGLHWRRCYHLMLFQAIARLHHLALHRSRSHNLEAFALFLLLLFTALHTNNKALEPTLSVCSRSFRIGWASLELPRGLIGKCLAAVVLVDFADSIIGPQTTIFRVASLSIMWDC